MAGSGGKDEKNVTIKTTIIGVQLVSESTKDAVLSLGILMVEDENLRNGSLTVGDLRTLVCQQIPAVPSQFMFLTHKKWDIHKTQEKHVKVCQIISPDNTLYIQRKYEKPKIGVRTKSQIPVGFVFEEYTATLTQLRVAINQNIPFFKGIQNNYQFLDSNCWPINKQLEGQVTVMETLVDACVCVCADVFSLECLNSAETNNQVDAVPRKRAKRLKELSLSTINKDSGWCTYDKTNNGCSSSDLTDPAKQLLISYARADAAEHALNLKEELSVLGFSVFLDVHEIKSGVDWQDSLNYAVSNCEVFVPLVTPRYGETQWTNREVKLADVLGKYILPVSFLQMWPPRSLAIQFATTQYISWKTPAQIQTEIAEGNALKAYDINCWGTRYVEIVAHEIGVRLKQLKSNPVNRLPSLSRRKSLMKTFAGKLPDGIMRSNSSSPGNDDRNIVICVHPNQTQFVKYFGRWLEDEGFNVWSSLQKETDYPELFSVSQDLLPNSQANEEGLSSNNNNIFSSEHGCSYQKKFQQMADKAGVVIVILSQAFSRSRTCQHQVFYCEHRKRVIAVKFEHFCMPGWLSMLIGTSPIEDVNQTDYCQTVLSRIRRVLDASGKDCFQDEVNESKLTLAVNHIRKHIGEQICVYIAGSTNFFDVNTEAICRCVGKELAKLTDITMVTGGFCGVGETVSRVFFDEIKEHKKHRVWHILPEKDCQNWQQQTNQDLDGTFRVVFFGKTLFCGESVRERETIVARTFDICILIEGGPGAAHEAEEFVWNDHIVIPIKCTGGAAGGKFSVPEKIFEVPQGVQESDWCILSKTTVSTEEIGQSVLRIVQSLKQKMCIEESKSTPTRQTSFIREGKSLHSSTSPMDTTPVGKPSLTSMKTVMLG